jgi:hypothetical protein
MIAQKVLAPQREDQMDFDDLITELAPPPNRLGRCDGELERHLHEGAVMVAYAMHLLRTTPATEILVHPDGEHGKRFDFAGWLDSHVSSV